MSNTTNTFKSKEFAQAWYSFQRNGDFLRSHLMNALVLQQIGNLRGQIVLDAGCGEGSFTNSLWNLQPLDIVGVDISEHLLNYGKRDATKTNFSAADLLYLPFHSNLFDSLICYNVLMELETISRAISEFVRVLKEGGIIHLVIVHPLYHLFVNDIDASKQTVFQRLQHYTKVERIYLNTIAEFKEFTVYRRPISEYINSFISYGLKVEKIIEVPINQEVVVHNPFFADKVGIPVFVYFTLTKSL